MEEKKQNYLIIIISAFIILFIGVLVAKSSTVQQTSKQSITINGREIEEKDGIKKVSEVIEKVGD